MARCFLTGVEFRVEDGHVLNRSDAYRLLRTFCIRHRTDSATEIAALIRSTICGNGDLAALGVPAEEHDLVRGSLMRILCEGPRSASSHERQ